MNGPRLSIEPLGIATRDGEGWSTTWRVTNIDPNSVRIVAVVAPHSQFRGEASLDREVRGNASTDISLAVRTLGAAASEIENAFVILLVEQGDDRWRILTRVRVPLDEDARPRPRVEAVTVQRVGFSGEL